jgi:hypothetical protein
MPHIDHISASKLIKQEGIFKRLADMLALVKHKETMTNNIFAPTGAIRLIKHLK